MFNPTREFLSSKLVVGLEIADRHIGMVQISGVHKSPKIEQVEFKEVNDSDQLYAEVASLFHEKEISYDALVTSIPTSDAYVRQISLPVEHPKSPLHTFSSLHTHSRILRNWNLSKISVRLSHVETNRNITCHT